jgi:hypothetical protein
MLALTAISQEEKLKSTAGAQQLLTLRKGVREALLFPTPPARDRASQNWLIYVELSPSHVTCFWLSHSRMPLLGWILVGGWSNSHTSVTGLLPITDCFLWVRGLLQRELVMWQHHLLIVPLQCTVLKGVLSPASVPKWVETWGGTGYSFSKKNIFLTLTWYCYFVIILYIRK